MQIDIVAFFVVLLFGCVAFVFGVLCLIGKTFAMMGRMIGRVLFGSGVDCAWSPSEPGEGSVRTCPRPACGKTETRSARFCSQCGLRLPDEWEYERQ